MTVQQWYNLYAMRLNMARAHEWPHNALRPTRGLLSVYDLMKKDWGDLALSLGGGYQVQPYTSNRIHQTQLRSDGEWPK